MSARRLRAGAVAACALLTGCAHTMAAVEALPVGYWRATEDLVLGVLHDAWQVLQWLL